MKIVKKIKQIVKKIMYKCFKSCMNDDFKDNFKNSSYYGKIYFPYYNDAKFESQIPDIYNQDGKKMDVWFIRDVHAPHCPYRDASKYFLWDRFNIGLDTHFYTHNSMLETMGTPSRRFGLFVESEGIVPEDYKIFENNKGLWKNFTNIFTYSEKMLNEIPNAKLFTSCATVWYGGYVGGGKLSERAYMHKEKNISTVCSSKLYTYMHKVRHAFTAAAAKTGLIDVYGEFEGGKWLENKSDSLEKYRFQLVVENDIKPYYFTEKIMDCFASMTVPIYLGATKISDFFNSNGIIVINENDVNNIDKIMLKCDSKLYESMIPAVVDNYNRALKYINVNDRLYEEYFI